ncbi:MAG: hypothetical protein COV38_14470 [Bdellovibrionales bacterium CG11_big_fil_rev_8_21_14_0_20_38_13]|nr:MAG: hypothetical protein COW79_08665 [Bdellovibrionales bacterium CG22_combo_CG10-13_8_21_14_all_38_13]PIR28739.1 MAG: hypothetical protein COV38_14470 [Bdellovibrionales bacterium CG11_big_fil_rev_8_21_14_0_20_38_13]
MNKILFIIFISFSLPALSMSQTVSLKDVQSITTPKDLNGVKASYDILASAIGELEKKHSDELAIAILKGYASVGKKDPSFIGIEDFAPYYKKHSKKVKELAKKNLDQKESKEMMMALESMSENVGLGNDPSVKK